MFGASSAIFVFIYCTVFFVRSTQMSDFVPGLVYFVYTIAGCLVYFLCAGTLSFFCTFFFLRKIYSTIKID